MRFQMKPNVGKHYVRDGTVLRPGDLIECDPRALGGAIGKFEALGPETGSAPSPETSTSQPSTTTTVGDVLTVVKVGDGVYNVINPASGLPVNDESLTAIDAANLAGVDVASFLEPVVVGSPPPETQTSVADAESAATAGTTTDLEAGNTQTTSQPVEDANVRES